MIVGTFDAQSYSMDANKFIPYTPVDTEGLSAEQRSADYRKTLDQRRSLRFFSDKEVSKATIENIIMTASSAPSGAWFFSRKHTT